MNNFEKVIGYDKVKTELERICDILNNPDKYSQLGVKMPKGLLLYGRPGTGKTTFANCFTEAVDYNTFVCRKNKPDGDFVKEITSVFEKAKENQPAIVFLDDMDKFANEDEHHPNAEEFVTVQSCIDEIKNDRIFILATANDLDNLPDSLLREGRFDKRIHIDAPEYDDAVKIIDYYLKQKKFIGSVDSKELARILPDSSCAMLETVINEAGILAGFKGKNEIDMEDLVNAILNIKYNINPDYYNKNDENAEYVSYHEAGHLVIAEILEPDSVALSTILGKGGMTLKHDNQKEYPKINSIENQIMIALAGKAAIEIKYGIADIGVNKDMHRAFDLCVSIADNYCIYGFDKWINSHEISNELLQRQEDSIIADLDRYYYKTRKLLVDNREFLDKTVKALVDKKTLLHSDIVEIKNTCRLS